MYGLKRRHRLVITGVAPCETGQGVTDVGFSRSELQFICQVSVFSLLMVCMFICSRVSMQCCTVAHVRK